MAGPQIMVLLGHEVQPSCQRATDPPTCRRACRDDVRCAAGFLAGSGATPLERESEQPIEEHQYLHPDSLSDFLGLPNPGSADVSPKAIVRSDRSSSARVTQSSVGRRLSPTVLLILEKSKSKAPHTAKIPTIEAPLGPGTVFSRRRFCGGRARWPGASPSQPRAGLGGRRCVRVGRWRRGRPGDAFRQRPGCRARRHR